MYLALGTMIYVLEATVSKQRAQALVWPKKKLGEISTLKI